jgi:hypothetical protein
MAKEMKSSEKPGQPWLARALVVRSLVAGILLGASGAGLWMCRGRDHDVKVSPVNGGGPGSVPVP